MAITQNNITFNDLSRIGKGSRFANVINPDIQSESDLKDYMDAGEEYRNIQSVLIDWNGAQVAEKTLNTTGEVLSLINDNNTDIKNVASSLQGHSHSGYATTSHSHANYATQSYVMDKINGISGGSGLDVENFSDTTVNYNLLVAPEGSEYTEIGSLDAGNDDWTSALWASVAEDGRTTLYSDNFEGNFKGDLPHSHANYATQSYVMNKINGISGGSGLDVENFSDTTLNYNLLVAPEGAKYASIGSLDAGNDEWTSALWASVAEDGRTTLYSDNFEGDLPHSHANYATQSYVMSKINGISGGSGLDVENFSDTSIYYNLLVAPEGSEYTEIGSVKTDEQDNWSSNLYAACNPNNKVMLYSDIFIGDLPHSHANYVTSTSIQDLQTQITDLTSRITELEELINSGSDTPTDPDTGGGSDTTQYYWYVGQDSSDALITTSNYKQYCQNVTNYQSTQAFTVNDKYLYLVVLADKTVEAIDSAGGPLNFKYLRGSDNVYIPVANDTTLITLDDGNIYRIYRSASTANDKYTITIK